MANRLTFAGISLFDQTFVNKSFPFDMELHSDDVEPRSIIY